MKKLTRNVIIMAVVTVIMAVVLGLYIKNTGTVPAADNAASLTDGIYTSSAQGCLSDVTVTVTVTGGRVTGVEIDASGETPELGGTAAETLADQLTKAGSTSGVDAVAGATMTSDAVFTAMDDCLSQAEKRPERPAWLTALPAFFLKIQHKEREHYGRIIQSGTSFGFLLL